MSAGRNIGCIVLAAGYSRRFGADKRQIRIRGETTLLDLTLASIPPLFATCILVLHPGDEALAVRYASRWQAILATNARLGMGHSLAAAVPWVAACEGTVIVLADMPAVQASTYGAITERLDSGHMVVPHCSGKRGNPVGIGAKFFPELATLEGDQGARELLQRHAAAVLRLEVEDPGILLDADTEETLAQLPLLQQDRLREK